MTSIISTHMSHPISCTVSERAAHNLTNIHLDSPNLTNWSTKPQYGQSLYLDQSELKTPMDSP
jgi:hypothetical protein